MLKRCFVFVNRVAIVFVPKDYGETETNDLMISVLLAQLVADKRIKKNSAASWSGAYTGVLDDFWIRNVKYKQEILLGQNSTASPLEWVTATMANMVHDEARVLAASLEWAARSSCCLEAMSVLRRNAQQEVTADRPQFPAQPNAVRLLAILALRPASMISVCLEFNTRQALEPNPWSQRFDVRDIDGSVSVRYSHAILSETLYGRSREAIALKVRDKFSDNVTGIVAAIDIPFQESRS
ncbi:hypothetical protein C1886_10350 [Pseudomonas sp. FW300-N1A1]|uniref:hypothetical protein n=1 Tax=Pseudomonas sp. FW300-N1A1 TaxID=2075555 RepID=UPI000CD283B8|nr:hypothetical protein [Pseudomonas sp. FW300-N1A1]POA20072.1 hypothetical protein C1886_10350 [Pseudomonas sp. FW300-N1A1]